MKKNSNSVRIGIAVAIILGTIGWLAFSGYGSSKSYYVTVAELGKMGDKAYKSNLRVEGFVQPGSIQQNGPHVTFVLNEFESHSPKAANGRLLTVVYKGSEPPPDTFKDDAMGIAMAPLAATASSTPRRCRPSAPANTPPRRPTASPERLRRSPLRTNPRASAAPQPGSAPAGIATN